VLHATPSAQRDRTVAGTARWREVMGAGLETPARIQPDRRALRQDVGKPTTAEADLRSVVFMPKGAGIPTVNPEILKSC
jgi:hypothetical protein